MGFRGRFAFACSVWTVLLVGPAAAHADIATCTYTAATHSANVTVTPTNGGSTGMSIRQFDGALVVESGANTGPCGVATRTNTDTITVTGGAATRGAIFRLGTGVPFAPGFTNEPGSSDEIEMSFDFSSGGQWYLSPSAILSPIPLNLALGGNQINLNAGEADGIDADAAVTGAYAVFVEGSLAADTILADGSAGTTGLPFAARIVASMSSGADLIVGGGRGDDLSGGLDPDTIFGGRGKDSLKGLGAKDRLFGQAGNDKLLGGAARDRLDGGAGQGDACTTKGDRVRRCELPAHNKK
jgi:Ca2+-binding RTX toxin-like protein